MTGPPPRTVEEIGPGAWKGIAALYLSWLDRNYLAQEYPRSCEDPGGGIIDTSYGTLAADLQALIPDLSLPVRPDEPPSTLAALDFVEFLGQRVAIPEERERHPFFKHSHLSFNKRAGQAEFRERVELVFARNGIAYTLGEDMRITRLLPAPTEPAVRRLLGVKSGDTDLDRLIEDAVVKYLSPRPRPRYEALETLWDAFERLKSLEVPGKGNKRESTRVLLDAAAAGPMRDALETESRRLTDLGNEFRIRHHEVDATSIDDVAYVDWLFVRMSAFLIMLLDRTGRI